MPGANGTPGIHSAAWHRPGRRTGPNRVRLPRPHDDPTFGAMVRCFPRLPPGDRSDDRRSGTRAGPSRHGGSALPVVRRSRARLRSRPWIAGERVAQFSLRRPCRPRPPSRADRIRPLEPLRSGAGRWPADWRAPSGGRGSIADRPGTARPPARPNPPSSQPRPRSSAPLTRVHSRTRTVRAPANEPDRSVSASASVGSA